MFRGAAFLGVAEPRHEVDSVPFGPSIPSVLGDDLTSIRRPDIRVAASLDLYRNIESAKAGKSEANRLGRFSKEEDARTFS